MNKPVLFSLTLILSGVFFSCGKKTEETKPVRKDVTETVFASGILEANGTYNLTAQVDGYLRQINFNEGDLVKAGSLLAVIDNKENIFNTQSANALYEIAKSNTSPYAPALVGAQNSIKAAREKLVLDSIQLQRYARLVTDNSVAQIDYDKAALEYKTSKANYESAVANYSQLEQQAAQQLITSKAQKKITGSVEDHNQIRAIVGGKVYKKYKQVGDYVKKGDIIAQIGNTDIIYAKINIDESNIARVKVGQDAVVQLNTDKTKAYKARVGEIYPLFDEATQSFLCKLYFTDSLDFRIAGTQLESNIIVGFQRNALLIPRHFLGYGGNVSIKGKKEPVKVVTKFTSNDWVQVISGIDENTVLVTDNVKENKVSKSKAGSQSR
jgi:multidrug efflux pump subunit AcrA (membrane-fusion protein)